MNTSVNVIPAASTFPLVKSVLPSIKEVAQEIVDNLFMNQIFSEVRISQQMKVNENDNDNDQKNKNDYNIDFILKDEFLIERGLALLTNNYLINNESIKFFRIFGESSDIENSKTKIFLGSFLEILELYENAQYYVYSTKGKLEKNTENFYVDVDI